MTKDHHIKKPPSVLFIITGSIAAEKAPLLASILSAARIKSRFLLSKAASSIIAFKKLQGLGDIIGEDKKQDMAHIDLSRENDLILVMPATANILAKMAHGLADDFISTLLLASNKKIMVVPAMNPRMWCHPATRSNMALLRKRGVLCVAPVEGMTACGEVGFGRMAEIKDIADQVAGFFLTKEKTDFFKNKRVMITAGPTRESIDPVRFISNHSSGRQGYALAEAFRDYGAHVTLISGPVALENPYGVETIHVVNAEEMLQACFKVLPCDIAVCAAAVSDWRARYVSKTKLKKDQGAPDFSLVKSPDILSLISHLPAKSRPALVIGFCAESGDPVAEAQRKRQQKKCDWIVANDIHWDGGVFGHANNQVTLITDQKQESWQAMRKEKIALALCEEIISHFATKKKKRYNA